MCGNSTSEILLTRKCGLRHAEWSKGCLLIILLISTLCNANQFLSFKKFPNNLGSVGLMNRRRVEGYRLNGDVKLSQEVIKEDDCFKLCLNNSKDCQTFNVIDNEDGTIKLCELIDGRAFTDEGNLEQDINSVHYGLETPCWEHPCKNEGTCVPDYITNYFSCNCPECYGGKFCENTKVIKSIKDTYSCANLCFTTSGVYQILIGGEYKDVHCNIGGGGKQWTLIQRRKNGNVDFERNWQDYKNGFGDASGDYWLGNDAIHLLTKDTCKLKFTMKYGGEWFDAYYDSFTVGDESSNYLLTVSDYRGTAGDDFSYHDGMMFSTFDKDNDRNFEVERNADEDCAIKFKGGWWYRSCFRVNINGIWGGTGPTGMAWIITTTFYNSLEYIDMKVSC